MNLTEILTLNKKRIGICFFLSILCVGIGTFSSFSPESNNIYYFFYNIISDGWYNFILIYLFIFNTLSIVREFYTNYSIFIRTNNKNNKIAKEVIKSNLFLFLITLILTTSSTLLLSGGSLKMITYNYNLPIIISILIKIIYQILLFNIISLIFMYLYLIYDNIKTNIFLSIFIIIFLIKIFSSYHITIFNWYEFHKIFLGLFIPLKFPNIISEILYLLISLLLILSILIILKLKFKRGEKIEN